MPAWRGKGAVRVLSLTVSCQQMSRPRRRAQPSQPACQPSQPRRDPPARIRGVAPQPIAASRDVTAGQSARAAVTTRAKYSRYISRPVATANYPQSRAGGRRRRISGLPNGADLSACAVREVRTRRRTRNATKVGIRYGCADGMRFRNRNICPPSPRFAINLRRNKPTDEKVAAEGRKEGRKEAFAFASNSEHVFAVINTPLFAINTAILGPRLRLANRLRIVSRLLARRGFRSSASPSAA